MKVAILDDEQEVRELLLSYLKRYEKEKNCRFEVETFAHGIDFISDYQSNYFKSEISSLEEVVRAQEEPAVQIFSEGSVLFKNNGALPINASGETVTLWGLNSLFPTRGGTIGSSVETAEGQANEFRSDKMEMIR